MNVTQKSFLLILCSICLSGCWDRVEVNDLAFVTATGVDKIGENKFRVSCQIPLPGAMGGAGSSGGGGGTGGAKPYYVDSGVGRNIRESNDNLQQRMSRQIYFAHRRVVIIGKDLAEFGFKKTLDVILVQPQSRLTTYVLITDDKAIDVLNSSPHLEQLPAEAIREMAKAGLGITVKDALLDIKRPGKDPVIPIVDVVKTQNQKSEEQKEEIELKRFAILKDDKYKFSTNPEETSGVAWLYNKMKGKAITYSVDENNEINVEISRESIKVSHKVKNNIPSFKVEIKAGAILNQNEKALKVEKPEIYNEMKNKLDETIKNQINAIIDHAKSESIDVFGFGWYLYRHENTLWQKNWKKNWDELLKDLEVKVSVDTDIRRMNNTGIEAED